MKVLSTILVIFVISMVFSGCAEMDVPKPKQMLTDSVGMSGQVRLGMSKDEILAKYGEPDMERVVTSKDWGGERDEWFYSKSTNLPIGMGHTARDAYLYFDGESLTNISDKPIASEKMVKESEFIK